MELVRLPASFTFLSVLFSTLLFLSSFSLTANAAPADGIVSWSNVDKDSNVTLANNELDALISGSTGAGVFGVRSTSAIGSGDGFFYLEIERLIDDVEFTVGVASASAPLTAADAATIEANSETAVRGEFWGLVSIAIDYRGASPVVYFFGNRYGGALSSSIVTMDGVTSPVYLYVASAAGGHYRLNFGGENGADFVRSPGTLIENHIFNGGPLLEYGMPILQAKPSLSITEGDQLVQQNTSVTFSAVASDANSTDLSSSVSWLVDGVSAGTGSSFSPSTTTAGSYTITAVVEDSLELSTSVKANLYVHPSAGGNDLDHDHDGLSYVQELVASTDPANPDTDGDGLSDGYEVANSSSPTNGSDPVLLPVQTHESSVYFNFESGSTSYIVSTSDDGLSVGYIPQIDGKAAIRANQSMKGEFRYWEGRALFDDDMGFGFVSGVEDIADYCCVTYPADSQDFSDPSAPGSSMSVNAAAGNTTWENLVNQGGYANNDDYIGLAIDYTGDDPVVYVIGSAGVEDVITLSDYNSAFPIFPMFYGNANINAERGPVAVHTANFGKEPFFYDIETILSTASIEGVPLNIDMTHFVPGWGKHRQFQHLNIDSPDQSIEAGNAFTFNASASDATGGSITSTILWTVLNSADEDVTATLTSLTPPVNGGSLTLTPQIADAYRVSAQITDSKTGQAFARTVTLTATPVVGDATPPVLDNIPADLSVDINSGSTAPATLAAISSFLTSPTATDNSGIVTVTHNAPADFPLGDTEVTFTAEDGANNQASASATVTVTFTDIADPVVTAPSDLALTITSGSSVAATDAQIVSFLAAASASDNVGVVSLTHDAPASFPIGDTTVTFTASDAAGRTGTDTAVVTVTFNDIEDPVVTAPSDLALTITSGSSVLSSEAQIVSFLAAATATDNVGVITLTHDAPASFPIGSTTVTFTASDAAGRTGTDSAVVTVTFNDIDDPVVMVPSDISITINSGSSVSASDAQIVSFLAAASATDNVGVVSFSNDAPANFPIGDTTVTFSASDAAGRTATGSAVVTVVFSDIDAPEVTAPSDLSITITSGSTVPASDARIASFLSSATATDNVGVASLTHNAPTTFPIGSTTVTFTASDAAGQSATDTAVVTIVFNDIDDPVVVAPADLSLTINSGSSVPATDTQIVSFLAGVVASDNVGVLSLSHNAPTSFPVGDTNVTFTALDAAGRTGSDTAIVRVTFIDIENPVVTAPADLIMTITEGSGVAASNTQVAARLAAATASDNVGVVLLSHDAPATFPIGATVVTFSAQDAAGLIGTASTTITIVDAGLPVITAPDDITVSIGSGDSVAASDAVISAFLNAATALDNADGAIAVAHDAPTIFLEGLTPVTFTASDSSANAAAPKVAFVRVVSTTLEAGVDSDGDGVSDADEGLGDTDGDRIPDYLENSADPSQNDAAQIQAGHNDAFLQTTPGLSLRLGETSFASENAAALVVQDNLSANGGAGGTAVGNAIDEFFEYPAGVYDFEVLGLTVGASAQVVVPMSIAIPAGAVYRKYSRSDGWTDFDLTADQVASAPGALGVCPAPGDASYTTGLTAGHYCVQLTIQDGGVNDADGIANGVIQDPGGVAVFIAAPNIDLNKSTTATSFSEGSGEQLVLAFVVSSDSSDAELNSLTLSASGELDEVNEVSVVRLYRDANEDGVPDTSELVSAANYTNDNGQITLSLPAPYRLPVGDTSLLITYEF